MIYKIHPAIGVARVGDSDDYYLAPETAGTLPILPDGKPFLPADFRDSTHRLRRQGARFQVFRYDEADPDQVGVPVRPGESGVERVEWTVHLANKKAIWYEFTVSSGEDGYSPDHPLRNARVDDPAERVARIIDPGPRTLTGPGQSVEFSRHDNPDDYPMTFPPEHLRPRSIGTLGGLRTDDEGRLIVLGGHGCSGSTRQDPAIANYANNDDWWDDTSDGPVTARVVMSDGTKVEVQVPSWVIVAPPRYAPQLINFVTLYDTIFDMAVRKMGVRTDIYKDSAWNHAYLPSWEQDLLPLLSRPHHYPWVVAIPPHPHDFDLDKLGDPNPEYNGLRHYYLEIVRPPDRPDFFASPKTGHPMMPYLCGDNCYVKGVSSSRYLTVTDTQYFFLMQWAKGKFTVGVPPRLSPGEMLDRASLENCVGGAFSPGIEMTWISRNPHIYSEPFRIKHKRDVRPPLSLGEDFSKGLEPGDVGKYMALPWQADFNECSQEQVSDRWVWWWPVQRPTFVHIRRDQHLKQVPWVGTDQDQAAPNYVQFADDIDMVTKWNDLGFVFNEGTDEHPVFIEVERLLRRHKVAAGAWGDAPAPE